MTEFITYVCIPVLALAWLTVSSLRKEDKQHELEEERWQRQADMDDYHREMLSKIAELEVEQEDIERQKKIEVEKSKNPLYKVFDNRK